MNEGRTIILEGENTPENLSPKGQGLIWDHLMKQGQKANNVILANSKRE